MLSFAAMRTTASELVGACRVPNIPAKLDLHRSRGWTCTAREAAPAPLATLDLHAVLDLHRSRS
jgi:hypothetical protein